MATIFGCRREFHRLQIVRRAACWALLMLALVAARSRGDEVATFDGIWRSAGYDLVLAIEDGRFTRYETTPVCTLKVGQGDLPALREAVGTLQREADGKRLSSQDDTSIAPIHWQRIARLPAPRLLAIGQRADDPLLAFDIVWHTFNDNYAFFELRGVDWNAFRDKYRGRLTSKSTDAELFEVLAAMLAALDDNHVELNAEGFDFEQHRSLPDVPLARTWTREYEAGRQDEDLVAFVRGKYRQYLATSARLIAEQMVDGVQQGADDKLVWGMLSERIGYLGIRAMAGFVAERGVEPPQHLAALDKTLDRAMSDLAGARAMIVDVRFNGGGWDPAAVRIANRFADRRRAAFTKKARTADGFTPPYTVYVEPAAKPFTRPVMLLTSPMTASAAEIFVFCMDVLPHVRQAGLPTMGIHSDQLLRHLPNGWRFSLSNEVYETVDGRVYEKVGIPPTVPLALFTDDDFAGAKDAAVETARAMLCRVADGQE